LKELIVPEMRKAELRDASQEWHSWELTARQLCDLELLLNGSFSPLEGYMTRRDYESVVDGMRLSDGTLWPIPIVLDVCEELAHKLGPGSTLALRDPEGVMLAVVNVEDVWQPDRLAETEAACGTTSR